MEAGSLHLYEFVSVVPTCSMCVCHLYKFKACQILRANSGLGSLSCPTVHCGSA